MDKYTHKAVNKTYISSEEIKSRLEKMKQLDIEAKEPEFNLIIIQTPNGNLKIKTKLTKEQWLEKYKSQAKKKDIVKFNLDENVF
ncbi:MULTISPECIES: hypothetical protein [Flavobacterium]|uniref:Uncharacterized protein n=1 Tax=Flavobacterium keumense TaxID=1306518 RepID=A0ABY8N3M9_9FLAO|nr:MULTISPECIES: hypothetical protein [Flavobacterium]WGK94254.1 hypothetical protein MG292_09225 [Flavobacterium keumense]